MNTRYIKIIEDKARSKIRITKKYMISLTDFRFIELIFSVQKFRSKKKVFYKNDVNFYILSNNQKILVNIEKFSTSTFDYNVLTEQFCLKLKEYFKLYQILENTEQKQTIRNQLDFMLQILTKDTYNLETIESDLYAQLNIKIYKKWGEKYAK